MMIAEALQFIIYGTLISAITSLMGASFIVNLFSYLKRNKRAK